MIAVLEAKHREIKTIEGPTLPARTRQVLEKLPADQSDMLARLLRAPVRFVDNPRFHDRELEAQILEHFANQEVQIAGSQARLRPIHLFGKSDLVTKAFKPLKNELEVWLFVKINYARYRIDKELKVREGRPLTRGMVRELLKWRKEEFQVRTQITQANLPLVLAMAKRTKLAGIDFADLISDGNMALLRSVDKFDCARGFKFSTYACRAILTAFARVVQQTHRYRRRFPVEFDAKLEKSDQIEHRREDLRVYCVDRLHSLLDGGGNNSETDLSDVEKRVLRARFALHNDAGQASPMTLGGVGQMIGLTKERVRQIQNRALQKLRLALDEFV